MDAVIKIKLRRGSLSNWQTENPVLLYGEVGVVHDGSVSSAPSGFVIGNGTSTFTDLWASNAQKFLPIGTILLSYITPLLSAIEASILAESTFRTNADAALQLNIDNEATARTNADASLQSQIDAEETARASADSSLQSSIDGLNASLADLIANLVNWFGLATAAGDILVFDPNTSSVGVLSVGADGQVLSAESTAPKGLKWINLPAIPANTDSLTEGVTNLYFTEARVLSTVLTGFTAAGSRTNIIATDTLLEAIGKVQKWLSDLATIAFSASASDLSTGTVPTARLGSGSADSTKFLSGDQSWQIPPFMSNVDFEIFNHFFTTTASQEEANSNTGTGAGIANITGIASPMGIMQATTGTTATGASLRRHINNNAFVNNSTTKYFRLRLKFPILSTGTETFLFLAGFGNAITVANTANQVQFRYTHSENGGDWTCTSRQSSVETAVNSGVAVVAGTWYNLEIYLNTTSATFYINGTLVATITTNLPSGTSQQFGYSFGIIKSVGTTARTVQYDIHQLKIPAY